jgi:exopolysaccharide biosynthesis predicted pyruvyltransferase EpsI
VDLIFRDSLMRRNEEVIATQVALSMDVLGKLLPFGTPYALIDFPDHSNVGDSAIWLGEVEILSQLTGNMPSYVTKLERFNSDELLKALPTGPILMHGGGNFGDIWPWYQDFREMIIERFKDRLIIQLPQTISFSKQSSIDRAAKTIAAHSNYHLLVRDKTSFEFANQYFQCSVQLVPDSAFGIGAIKRTIAPSYDIYMLLREDAERADFDRALLQVLPNSMLADWLEEPTYFEISTRCIARSRAVFNGSWSKNEARLVYYQMLATSRLNRGLKMLSSGRRVITDRLHAHLDNNYGKISSYISAWTNTYPALKTAKTAEEALEKLATLPKA